MKLVIDLQSCQSASRHRGIGRYSLALARAMARMSDKHEIWVALNAGFPDSIENIRAEFDTLVPRERIVSWQALTPLSELDPPHGWRRRTSEILRESFLAGLRPDVVHLTSLFEGFSENTVTSVGALMDGRTTGVTLYDLIPLIYADRYLAHPSENAWYRRRLAQLRQAGLWLAISESSRQDGIDRLNFPADNVVNISGAADAHFQPVMIADDEQQALRRRYGLTRPFVMYTGGVDHRKNIEGLINAYARLPAALRQQYQLAVVCTATDDSIRALRKRAKHQGLAADELVMTGFVLDRDLLALYNLCTAFCFPSLYEGFGLPALEAMQCGAPTIGSNTSSVPEVIGRTDAMFDPRDEGEIAARLQQVLTDADYRRSLKEHGLQQARKFTWKESARRAWAAFEAHCENTSKQRQADLAATRVRRPRLAYVSPLPPEQSGIADYSAELLPELARHYDIDVVNQGEVGDPWIKANCRIRDAAWFEEHVRHYERVIYQFGNSPLHRYMFDLIDRCPGVVVLHDFYLGGVVFDLDLYAGQPGFWSRALYQSHGYHALHDSVRAVDVRDIVRKYPANLPVLQKAAGIIVHSDYARRLAAQFYGEQYPHDWVIIPQLRRSPPASGRDAARKALGFADQDFLLCSFGIMHPTKMNHRLLQAWLNSKLGGDQRRHLAFVGKDADKDYIAKMRAVIGASPARNRIRITGFVPGEVLEDYLDAADLAVQLRTFSSGETSRSVFDSMAHGVSTIVNAYGSMAEIDKDCVLMLPDEFTDDELTAAIEALHDHPKRREAIGERGRAFVSEHLSPRTIAGQYFTAIEHFAEYGHRALMERTITALAAVDPAYPNEAGWLDLARAMHRNTPSPTPQRQLLVDVTELVARGLTTGAQRVKGTSLQELILNPPAGYRVEPVYKSANESGYRYARTFTLQMLDGPANILKDDPIEQHPDDVFVHLDP